MRRRHFISALVGAVSAWPLAAAAQQSMLPVIGFLGAAYAAGYEPYVSAFRDGLRETGYVEGQNVVIQYRWAEGQYDRLPSLAAELVRRRVAVIVTSGGDMAVLAAKAATRTIPVVFSSGGDPVKRLVVESLSRPGGNLTGISLINNELNPKRFELLRELLPSAKMIAMLVNPNTLTAEYDAASLKGVARTRGVDLEIVSASDDSGIAAAFATIAERKTQALLVGSDPFFTSRRERLVAMVAERAIPAIYEWREFAAAGGLMSYGADLVDAYRQVGIYAGRILKGAKPADLPVMQSTRIELVVNLKTARALDIAIPQSILARADEVLE